MRKSYEIFADYFQIYIQAPGTPAPLDYTDADCIARILAAPGVVVVMPERNMTVPVTLEIAAAAPPLDLAGWDHVAEASLDLPDGRLEIEAQFGFFHEDFDVTAGCWRVRFCGADLASLRDDDLDGDDRYMIALWPAPMAPTAVLKQYERR